MRIRTCNFCCVVFVLILLGSIRTQAWAAGASTLRLRATRYTILADGKHTTDIIADVRDSNGRPVSGNVSVQFSTDAGTLSQSQASTNFSGEARIQLTSAPVVKTAHVVAFTPGAAADSIAIDFTDDPEATFEGNNYMAFVAKTYLAYSATDRVVQAEGKDGGARLTYRNLDLVADRLQFRCDDGIVRAFDHVVLKRGKNLISGARLYYSLVTGQGYIISPDAKGELKPYLILGENLTTQPSPTPPPGSYMAMPELQVKLVIVARSITYFPGEKLQFRRPRFYQDTVQIMSLPYYELALNSQELFSDHFVSFGTSGLTLTLPYYLDLSARGSTIATLHHQEQLGRGYYATDPNWGIDIVRGYSSQGDHRYEGAYGFEDLLEGDWSFRWTHNQEFNSRTQGSFYVDMPHHNSLFSSANINQELKVFRWGMNVAAGQTFITNGGTSTTSNLFAETIPHRLMGSHDFMYAIGTSLTSSNTSTSDPNIGNFNDTVENVTFRAFTRPIPLDKRTTLTNSFTVGEAWTGHSGSGATALATLSLDRTLRGGGNVNLTYDFVQQPQGLYVSTGKHRISGSYNVTSGKRLQLTINGTMYMDVSDSSVLADMTYRVNSHWRVIGSLTLERFQGQSYSDLEIILGRRIGARELQLGYSTLLRRLSLDLTSTHF